MVFLAELHKNKVQTVLICSKSKKAMVPYVINMYFFFFQMGIFYVFEFLIAYPSSLIPYLLSLIPYPFLNPYYCSFQEN